MLCWKEKMARFEMFFVLEEYKIVRFELGFAFYEA